MRRVTRRPRPTCWGEGVPFPPTEGAGRESVTCRVLGAAPGACRAAAEPGLDFPTSRRDPLVSRFGGAQLQLCALCVRRTPRGVGGVGRPRGPGLRPQGTLGRARPPRQSAEQGGSPRSGPLGPAPPRNQTRSRPHCSAAGTRRLADRGEGCGVTGGRGVTGATEAGHAAARLRRRTQSRARWHLPCGSRGP